MGITDLNYLIKQFDTDSIKEIKLFDLKNQKIAIDITIYLYKAIKLNINPVEYIFKQILHLKRYKIDILYVFDGRPPKEKWAEIKKRTNRKLRSLEVVNFLENQNDTDNFINDKICELKQNCVSIDKNIKLDVKNLLEIMKIEYIEPKEAEADKIIGILYKTGKIDGCISEDNDMLVYGCKKLYRFYKLNSYRIYEYNLDNILNDLNLTYYEFIDMCILCGSDYYKNISYNSSFRNSIVAHYLISKYKKIENIKDKKYIPENLDYNMIRNIYIDLE